MENLDIFNELGFEAEQVDEIERISIPEEYTLIDLNELMDAETFEGKPVLSEVISFTVDEDGEEVKKYKLELILFNSDMEEALKVNINLKQDGDIHENIYSESKLFALVGGLANLKAPGCMKGYNRIKKVDLDVIRRTLEDMDSLKIRAIEQEFNNIIYNTFRVLKE